VSCPGRRGTSSPCRRAAAPSITLTPTVALDYIINCQPGCYTLVGQDLNSDGNIINPKRADWKTGSAFVTPPGYWHAPDNESGAPAQLTPIQDAGLHTYLRSLDISSST
jgi:hypothetical protein